MQGKANPYLRETVKSVLSGFKDTKAADTKLRCELWAPGNCSVMQALLEPSGDMKQLKQLETLLC